MRLSEPLKNQLAAGHRIFGSWLALGSSSVAEVLARAGFDFLVIDLEHAPICDSVAADMIRTIELSGVSPLVRVDDLNPARIKRLLDAGAHGIIVPNVKTASEARKAVQLTRYPPIGVRGVGLHRAQDYGRDFDEYCLVARDQILVVLQIESMQGIASIPEIATVEGIDALMLGPYDLSSDVGTAGNFDSAQYQSAVEDFKALTRTHGLPMGIHVVQPDTSGLTVDELGEMQFVVFGVDFTMLTWMAESALSKWRSVK